VRLSWYLIQETEVQSAHEDGSARRPPECRRCCDNGGARGFLGPPVKGWFEKRNQAAALRSRNVPPLLQAAYDLQSRLYNIVRQDFMRAYASAGGEQHAYAVRSTLWLLAQYLGWVEILRREGQFLDFGSRKKNRQLQGALSKITHELSTDKRGAKCAVFRGEQRAIGELMTRTVHDAKEGEPRQKDCLGYAEFVRRLDEAPDDNGSESADFLSWFSRLRGDLQSLANIPHSIALISHGPS
jgi:hypothetical protein